MSIGTMIHNRAVTYQDTYTGHEVTRMTEPDHTCHHMYFYNRMTTADGKKVLYCAELGKERQLYLMDLDTGDAVQLTEGTGLDDYSGMITADDKAVIYQQENAIWKVALDTLTRVCLYRAAEGWNCGSWGMSDDNRFLAMVETRRDTLPDLTGKKGWEFFPIICAAKPLCHLVYLDVLTGKSHVVVEDRCWFGHAQIRPHDPDTILFCHEGPYDMIDARLWLVQSDGSNYRCARQQPNDLIITHEFWMPDGKSFAYVRRETTGDHAETICFMKPEELKETPWMSCLPYAHFICDPQMRYFAGDSQGSDTPIHLRGQQGDDLSVRNDIIYLVDIAARTETPLCWHGTSWTAAHGTPQDAHPHPCFTGDGKRVLFTSDKDGKPALYQVKL